MIRKAIWALMALLATLVAAHAFMSVSVPAVTLRLLPGDCLALLGSEPHHRRVAGRPELAALGEAVPRSLDDKEV